MNIIIDNAIGNVNLPDGHIETHRVFEYTLATSPEWMASDLTAERAYLEPVDALPWCDAPAQSRTPNVRSYVALQTWYVRAEDAAEYAALLTAKQDRLSRMFPVTLTVED